MVKKKVCSEYIVTRQLKDFDGKPKWFTFYPEHKGGKPSNVFKSKNRAEKEKKYLIEKWGQSSKDLRIGCYVGKKSKKYNYLDRY